jgi:hypothetical protein
MSFLHSRHFFRLLWPILLLLLLLSVSSSHAAASWGSANFNATCSSPQLFDQYFSYYLSFEYRTAREGFQRLVISDPGCCVAHWAVALTRLTLLWNFPDNSTFAAASSDQALAAACAASSSRMSSREKAYVPHRSKRHPSPSNLQRQTAFPFQMKPLSLFQMKPPSSSK